MATPLRQDLSTPEASVRSFLQAWRDNDPVAQWNCLLKIDPAETLIEFRLTDAIVETLNFDQFRDRFPGTKAKFFDRYELRFLRSRRTAAGARVFYAARRKDWLPGSLPFFLSRREAVANVFGTLLGLRPWYDALSYYDVVQKGAIWLISDWRYYKY